MNDELENALTFDPLAEAEKLTGGGRWDENPDALALGFAFVQMNGEHKEHLLRENNDVSAGTTWEEALAIYADLGFVEVFSEEFKKDKYEHSDTFKVFWREDGVLLQAESFWSGKTVNSAKLYYNWVPNTIEGSHKFTSSGSFHKDENDAYVWVGDSDVREGLRHKLTNFKENGEFLPQWKFQPFMWLVNYSVSDNYKEENERITALLPEHVRKAIDAPYQ